MSEGIRPGFLGLGSGAAPVRSVPLMIILCSALAACAPETDAVDVGMPLYIDDATATGADADAGPLLLPVSGTGEGRRTLLPNETSLPGENFMLVQPGGRLGGRMSIDQMLRSAGPMSPPFEYVIARDFMPLSGGLSYVRAAPAENVNCVLVVGTVGAGGYGRSDNLVMRNCVEGEMAEALAPVTSRTPY